MIDNLYDLNKCTGATNLLWSNTTDETNYDLSYVPLGSTHICWQWHENINTADSTEASNHKLEAQRAEEFFKKDFWTIDKNGNVDASYNESIYTDNILTMIYTTYNGFYYGAFNFDAATSLTGNSIPVSLKKREKGATFPMIVNLGNYIHGGSFSYREEETPIASASILRPLDAKTNYYWERYGDGGQSLSVYQYRRGAEDRPQGSKVADDVATKINLVAAAATALAYKGYDTRGYTAKVDFYSYNNASDAQKKQWFGGIQQIRGRSFYESDTKGPNYLGHVAHVKGLTISKTINSLSQKKVYDHFNKSWPISCGAIVNQNTIRDGKLKVNFKVNKKAWVMFYCATDPDIKWGPLGRSSASGTEYKRVENYINASNVNVMQVRELDIKQDDYIAVVVIPENSGDLAELTIDSITLTVDN